MSKGLKAQRIIPNGMTSKLSTLLVTRKPEEAEDEDESSNSSVTPVHDSDLFSFLSAMHLNCGSILAASSPHQQSRKRKILDHSSEKRGLRGSGLSSSESGAPDDLSGLALHTPQCSQSGFADEENSQHCESNSEENPPSRKSNLILEIDHNLADNFEDSLSGLGHVEQSGDETEALLALPNLSISSNQSSCIFKQEAPGSPRSLPSTRPLDLTHEDGNSKNESATKESMASKIKNSPTSPEPSHLRNETKKTDKVSLSFIDDHKFLYMLMAATSIATKNDEPTITYLNQGHSYELRLKKLGDLSAYRKKQLFKSVVRISFHERRLQYSESEQISEWSATHPGERILDTDIANSYGITDLVRDSSQLNVISFKWDPTRDTAIAIKVNCISTEFTPKKHGGEKGVPFKLQVETQCSDESSALRLLHSSSCILQIFKLKGADRKHKQDREKISKKPIGEQEKFAKPCKTTVLTELTNENLYISPMAPCPNGTPPSVNDDGRWTLPLSTPPSLNQSRDGSPYNDFAIVGNMFIESPPLESNSSLIGPSSPRDFIIVNDSPEDVSHWLSSNRYGNVINTFKNYNGRDILRLTREEILSLIGTTDGIRLYNDLHLAIVPPRLTFYVAQRDSEEFSALYLYEFTVEEFMKQLALTIGLIDNVFSKLYLIGSQGILIKVSNTVIQYMKSETIFHFSLRSGDNSRFDVILEEVSLL